MKLCNKCDREKDLQSFHKNKSKKDGLSGCCKTCQRQYNKAHYRKNRSYYKTKARNYSNELALAIREHKEANPCVDCGENYPYYVMDFDHLREKEADVAVLLRNRTGLKRLWKEIDKCELVCANCHRYRTHKRAVGEMGDHAGLRNRNFRFES